ncbi:MAG: ABC transporter ATP-binding protein [Phycisphaerae bacterium]
MGDSIVRALDGVDLEIRKGEFVAITGASGSGKSTIMHLLGCLDRPTAGTYLLDGRNVGEMSDRELARIRNKSIGFVFQTFNLINRTSALENVGVPLFYARRANTRGPAKRALERVGLAPRASHTPAELSGGERQRVAIARAIVNDPLLLLADEPTGNLDTRTGRQIMDIFSLLNEQGVTIVLVTHEQQVALRAKRVVQMRDGKVVSDRLTEQIRSAGGGPPLATPVPMSAFEPEVGPQVPTAPTEAAPAAMNLPLDTPTAQMKPRLVAGANGAFGCGVAAPLLLVLAFLAGLFVARMNVDPSQFGRQHPPPVAYIIVALFAALCLLLAIVAGFISIFWGRAVLKRIRTVPGAWLGAGRARAAWICGLLTVLIPVAQVGYNIVRWMIRASRV